MCSSTSASSASSTPCGHSYGSSFFFFGPILFIRDHIFPRLRLWLSKSKKGVAELRSTKDLRIPPQILYIPRYQSCVAPNTKLTHILTIEHVLLNVVEYLHFEDVVNLSLTRRAIRELVYPPRDLEHRVPKLLRHCEYQVHVTSRSCAQNCTFPSPT